jgi:hypothetical protein
MLLKNLASILNHSGTASMVVPLLAIIFIASIRKDEFKILHIIFFLYIYFISCIQICIFYLSSHRINDLILISIGIPFELFALSLIILNIYDKNAIPKAMKIFLIIFVLDILFYQGNEFPLVLMISECVILVYICLEAFNHIKRKTFEYYIIVGLLYYASNTIILFGLLKYLPDFSRALLGLTNCLLNYFYFRGILCLKSN